MLKVENLTYFGVRESPLFSNLGFSLADGEFLQLIGKNGVGKTTLLKVLLGLLERNTGKILYNQRSCASILEALPEEVLYLSDQMILEDELTINQNLTFLLALLQTESRRLNHDVVQSLLENVGLHEKRDHKIARLSRGEKQRILLAILFYQKWKLWILDEPLIGIDAAGVLCFQAVLESHLRAGGMAILVSHQTLATQPTYQIKLGSLN